MAYEKAFARAPFAVLVLGGLSLAWFVASNLPGRAFWIDEYFTLYFADPTIPLAQAWDTRLTVDTHIPFYYLLARAALSAGLPAQTALALVNGLALLLAAGAGALFFARVKRPGFGLAAAGLFLAAPATLSFVLEGRAGMLAQAAAFALTAALLSRLLAGPRRGALALVVGLALLATLSHLYAALYTGALGAGVTLVGLLQRRGDLIRAGLAAGLTASLVTAGWIAYAAAALVGGSGLVGWMQNGPAYMFGEYWYLHKFLNASNVNVPVAVALAGLCAASRAARPVYVLGAVVGVLFCAIPLAVSTVLPMVQGRGLAIAAPGLLLLLLLAAWLAAEEASTAGRTRLAGATGLAAGVYFLIASLHAPAVGRLMTQARWTFDAEGARAGVERCADARVRIVVPPDPAQDKIDTEGMYHSAYARALARPGVALVSSVGPERDVADFPCTLVGWGEHTQSFILPDTDEAGVLAALRLTNRGGQALVVRRHHGGFLLLRAPGEAAGR